MEAGQVFLLFVIFLLAVFVLVALAKSVRIVPQARAGIVERLGRYQRTLSPGLAIVVPFIDRVLPLLDLREQVVSFPPQPVITQDNLVVSIDTVIYYQVNDPKAATYEIANYIQGIEQLAVTTLRNVIGGMDLERTLTSREEINSALRGVLDEATGKWGIRVNRVELKAIDPPPSIQDSMEKQMRADRDKRAAILNAEGVRQSQILTAEGQKQSAILAAEGDKTSQILRAEADKQAAILRADGESKAIAAVFNAIHKGRPDQKLLSYQYLQMLPEIAKGDANKVWIVPSEIGAALEGLGTAVGKFGNALPGVSRPGSDNTAADLDLDEPEPAAEAAADVSDAADAAAAEGEAAVSAAENEVREALRAAEAAAQGQSPTAPAPGDDPGDVPEPPPVPQPPRE
ncbi:SPFH domain-containing protein [Phytoactinopolyspora limicola]|uniref:SPFH domain-containing protein n=1 Tax=Phytoactinopolyspora limicola TaxID=2715536 RepID=UPI00140CA032|nr:SPFH domain-containing protein [Phytoactinopolyspora limicola]